MSDQAPISAIMMGPSRVGKTTLITALTQDANRFLRGTPVTIEPGDDQTRARLNTNRRQLDGELYAGEFDPGALSGTQSVTKYLLEVHAGKLGQGLQLEFMDFPGGLLTHPDRRPKDWARVQEFLPTATALIIPIDATVLMEATLPAHRSAVPSILSIPEVSDVASTWTKRRIERPAEPALLILAPVKCESYFTDNGGRRDKAAQLFGNVTDAYHHLIDAVRGEINAVEPGKPKPNLTIRYAPIDTIGCVEVQRAMWNLVDHPQDGDDAPLELDVTYMVRPPTRRTVIGAESILTPLAQQVVNAMQNSQQKATDSAQSEADRARRDLEDRGFFTRVWDWVSRNERRLKDNVTATAEEKELATNRLTALEKAVESLASRPTGPRERPVP